MSRSARVVLLTATAAAVLATSTLVAAPGEASRAVAETYTVPADGILRLTGHGFGHGHGMSQYGAQGAAAAGLTHRQILSFYYPGTTLGSATGTIRVLVSADTDHDVRVVPATGLRVREVGSATSYALSATGVTTWRLRSAGGATVVDYDRGGWHTWRTLPGEAELYRGGPLTLRVAGTTRAYRGALRLAAGSTVNVVAMDDYVRGVVPREMPASWLPQAVRAQAVAARTYGAFDRAAHPTRSWQTCDTTSCQVYGGVAAEDARSNSAVGETAGQVLMYAGRPAFAQFGSSSGGWTSAGGAPYLVAKADPYDAWSGNAVHTWTTTLSRVAVQRVWPSLGTLQRVQVRQREGYGEWYGRVESLVLDGSRGDVTVSGSSFRSTFGLRSTWFRFGSGTPAPTPAPATAPASGPAATPAPATPSPITARWRALGGPSSVLGASTTAEYAVAGGHARRFAHGRIFATFGSGAHELYGPVLTAYARRGAATSRLGFPRTRPITVASGRYARFEHGVLLVRRSGRVVVTYSAAALDAGRAVGGRR